jgi:hypothetical protein
LAKRKKNMVAPKASPAANGDDAQLWLMPDAQREAGIRADAGRAPAHNQCSGNGTSTDMTGTAQHSIHAVLAKFRTEALNNRDLGDKFERLICSYLRIDPLYADRFSDVWLFNEWPQKGTVGDVGIDIVARARATRAEGPRREVGSHDHPLQRAHHAQRHPARSV